jgi:pyridoxine 4-dehydrogenase
VLTGQIRSPDDFPENDHRRMFPRFQPENFENNLKLVDGITAIAEKKGCPNGQVAIGWVLGLSKQPGMPEIIPIPGASKAERVRENAKVVELTAQEMNVINALLEKCEVKGDRYPALHMKHVNG